MTSLCHVHLQQQHHAIKFPVICLVRKAGPLLLGRSQDHRPIGTEGAPTCLWCLKLVPVSAPRCLSNQPIVRQAHTSQIRELAPVPVPVPAQDSMLIVGVKCLHEHVATHEVSVLEACRNSSPQEVLRHKAASQFRKNCWTSLPRIGSRVLKVCEQSRSHLLRLQHQPGTRTLLIRTVSREFQASQRKRRSCMRVRAIVTVMLTRMFIHSHPIKPQSPHLDRRTAIPVARRARKHHQCTANTWVTMTPHPLGRPSKPFALAAAKHIDHDHGPPQQLLRYPRRYQYQDLRAQVLAGHFPFLLRLL